MQEGRWKKKRTILNLIPIIKNRSCPRRIGQCLFPTWLSVWREVRAALKSFAFSEQKKPSSQEPEGRRCMISSTTKSLIAIVTARGDRTHLSNG